MADIVRQPSEEGTLQGSPLSPLLSNVSLDDLDRVLERRGHHFVRCTDDITIYVRSERPAERVMKGSMQLVERLLKLRVNRDKSAVDSAWRWTLLGFGFLRRAGRVDPKARKCAKDRLRRLTSRRWGVAMGRRITEINRLTVGWRAYFALADASRPRGPRRVAPRQDAAGPLEGVEALPDQAAQPVDPRHSRAERPRVVGLAPGLEDWRSRALRSFSAPCRTPTGASWACADSPIPIAVFGEAKRAARCGPGCRVAWEGPA